MQNNQGPPQENWQSTTAQGLGMLYFVATVLATSVGVFIRRGFGSEALGLNSVFAFLTMFFLAGESGDRAFLCFMGAFSLAQVWRRIETFRIFRSGQVLHSQYAGYPYLAMKMPFVKSEKVAREFVEPVFCFITGILLCPFSVNVGGYIAMCGIAFFVRNCMDEVVQRKRIQRMHDARIEHEWYSDQTRR